MLIIKLKYDIINVYNKVSEDKYMKKFLLLFVCLILILESISVFAATFPDVQNHWAEKEIDALTNRKIITGYDNGNFGPEDSIKRVDALLLAARIIGAADVERSAYLDISNEKYYSELKDLGFDGYEKTLSFLIYNDLYTVKEIKDFLSNSKGSEPLKRIEAAEMLAKISGKADELKNTSVRLNFNDAEEIPAEKAIYVSYCQQQGLMKGMDNNNFNPDGNVTRAQIAVMLYRVSEANKIVYSQGTITEINSVNDSIKYVESDKTQKNINGMKKFSLKLTGEKISDIEKLNVGDTINVIFSGDTISLIECLSDLKTEELSGIFEGSTVTKNEQRIKILPDNDTSSRSFTLSSDCQVTVNGSKGTLNSLTAGDHITITLNSDIVVKIISKNVRTTVKGYISKIVISNSPSVAILSNGKTSEYSFSSSDTEIKLDNNVIDIYSLKLGYEAELTLFNDKIESISANSKEVIDTDTYINGTVKLVNTSFNYLIVTSGQNAETQVFINSKTVIHDANGKTVKFGSDLNGSTVKIKYRTEDSAAIAENIALN